MPALHSMALALLLAQASPASLQPDQRISLLEAEVVADLLQNDLDALLRRDMPKSPSVDDVIKRLSLCLRAGRRTEARALLDRLAAMKIDVDLIRPLLTVLINRREIDLAARLTERVPGLGRETHVMVAGNPVADTSEPHIAAEAYDRGNRAIYSRMPAQAALWFERALAMPFTPEDVQKQKWGLAIVPNLSDAEWERRFRSHTRLMLARAYTDAGEPAKAQAVLRQAAIEDPSIVSDVDFGDLAGGAQIGSGARQLEQEIRAREGEDGKSIDYWMARARYFIALKEEANAHEAFERALTLAHAEPPHRSKFRHVLQLYSDHLDDTGAHADARQVFRRVLAFASTRYDDWVFDELAEHIDDDDQLAADSEWIWKELQRRANWEPAIGLLEELVTAEDWDKRAPVVNRAVAVAGDERGRVLPLARALKSAGEPGAAASLFERALADVPPADVEALSMELMLTRKAALRKQFNAEINQEDWRRAEQTWTTLLQSSSSTLDAAVDLSFTASAYSKLADAAGRKGAKAEALRFWRVVANIDRTADHFRLESFPLLQYRAELREVYEQMAKRDPASWVPAAALDKLSR